VKEVIISAFNRDYSWIDQLNSDILITVYRKGTDQKNHEKFIENNVGRDVHTFYYHFVRNYNSLSDYTFTSQDYFADHVTDYLEIINGEKNLWESRAKQIFSECWFFSTMYPILNCDKEGKPHHPEPLHIEKIWNELFVVPCPDLLSFTAAGHFCVSKNHLHQRPLEFYQKILNILETDDLSPWIIERLNSYIFDTNYDIKL
jgi:hypothetical protein